MRFVNIIDFINERVGILFSPVLILIMILATFEVIMRYFFSSPTTWAWEINSQLMCFMGAMAGGYTLLKKSHVSVDIIAARFSPKIRAGMDIITSIFFFFFTGCLIWYGAKEAIRAYMVNQCMISQFASPLWPIKTVIVIGGVLIFLQGVAKLIRDIRTITCKEET